ncbi:MAG: hypothetical protein ACMG57_00855 [Candidatus Dojkabacteria bacterium]
MQIIDMPETNAIYFSTIREEVGTNTPERIQIASKQIAELFKKGLNFKERNGQLADIAANAGITLSAAYEIHTYMGNLSTWQSYLEA